MNEAAFRQRLAAILAADAAGYSRLMAADEAGTVVALDAARACFRSAIEAQRGRVIDMAGDSVLALFETAAGAVSAALAVQGQLAAQAAELPEERRMRFRIGVHLGDVIEKPDGSIYGDGVNIAARLQALAEAGGVTVSDAVHGAVKKRIAARFDDQGEQQVKNIGEPVRAYRVREGAASDADAAPPVAAPPAKPAPIALSPAGRERAADATPFIGRARELAALDAALAHAREGRGRSVMLSGAPGIGKTRIAQQAAENAGAHGVLALWGRCPEEPGAPPYWPWRQLLRQLLARHDAQAVEAVAGAAAAQLASLDPTLAARLPPHPPQPAPADAAQARFALFDAISGVWQRAAARQPLLLVLDDLHCADVSSLKLLEFVAADAGASRLLLLGTYRDAEVTRTHPLSDTLGMLARQGGTQRLKLAGFAQEETAQFAAASGAAPVLAAAMHERSEGHPLFLVEMTRLLDDTGRACATPERQLAALQRVPAAVGEVIGSRLNRLSPLCGHALGNAAAIGRRFDLATLVQLLDETSEEQCLSALDEARRAAVVEALPEPGAFQFTHALVRDALYEEMPAPRRARLHQRIASALEARHGGDPGWLSALAHHWQAARSAAEPGKAAEYAIRAARHADETSAYEEAARLYQLALQSIDPAREAERCELLLALGETRTWTGEHELALEAFNEAAKLARRVPSPVGLARAAIGYENVYWRGTSGVSLVAIALVKEALAANPAIDSEQRARLLAALCRALSFSGRVDAAVVIHDQAVRMARRLGDQRALFIALSSIIASRAVPDLLPLRLAAGREATVLAEGTGFPEWAFGFTTGWFVSDLMEAGDIGGAARAADFGADTPALVRQPYLRIIVLTCRTLVALHTGRFAEAEQMALEAMRVAARYGQPNGSVAVQMFSLRREQGRLAELAPVLEQFQRDVSERATWQPGYTVLCCELGRHEQAQAAFERLAGNRFEISQVGVEGIVAGSLVYLAEACAWLGDAARAATLYEKLKDRSGLGIVFGANVVSFGSADRPLGMLAATMQRWDDAEAHYQRAIAHDEKSGGRPWAAHSRHEYASMLLERRRSGDAERANALLDQALATARELGMARLEARATALRQAATARESYPAGLSAREVQVLCMVAEGKTNQEIANALFRSVNTVANHVRNILAKIACANRTEAAAFAVRHGLVKRR